MQTLSYGPAPLVVTAPAAATRSDKFGYAAEKCAKEQRCVALTPPTLVATGPGFEAFSVACSVGEPLLVCCELGNCRALR